MDFSSPTSIITLVIVLAGIALVGRFLLRAKPKHEVLFCRPRDRRGERLTITTETDRSIACERKAPIHRFIKTGEGYIFKEGGQMVTRFWGIEGTAYTGLLTLGETVKLSIKDYLIQLWGETFYNKMPSDQKEIIEQDVIGVTVEPIRIDEEYYGYPTLTSDDINDEGDAVVLKRIADANTPNTKRELYQMMIGALLGFGGAAILLRMGLF